MARKIGKPRAQRLPVWQRKRIFCGAPVHFQRAYRRHKNHGARRNAGAAALNIKKFLCAEVRSKAGLCNRVVTKTHRKARCNHGVAAVRNVCKRSAVHNGRSPLQRLHQIRLQSIPQKRCHGALRMQLPAKHGSTVIGIGDDHAPKPLFQIRKRLGKTKHRHGFACNRDIKGILPGNAVCASAEAVHQKTQLAVIHVHAAMPGNAARVDAKRIALMNMVVNHCGKQVICGADGVKIPGEMQIDILHWDNLRISAACRPALKPEYGTERWLPQRDNGVFFKTAQRICKPDGRRCFSLARWRRSDCRDMDKTPRGFFLRQKRGNIDLCFIFSVWLQCLLRNSGACGNRFYFVKCAALCNFNIALLHKCPFHSLQNFSGYAYIIANRRCCVKNPQTFPYRNMRSKCRFAYVRKAAAASAQRR